MLLYHGVAHYSQCKYTIFNNNNKVLVSGQVTFLDQTETFGGDSGTIITNFVISECGRERSSMGWSLDTPHSLTGQREVFY